MQRTPLRVTFDTNAYSPIVRPQLKKIFSTKWPITKDRLDSIKRRFVCQYLNWCIRRGRIVAAIPEAVLAAELLPKEERVKLIIAVGTRRAAAPQPITPGRVALIQESFQLGFRALHYPRIAYGDLINVEPHQWAIDALFPIDVRQSRASQFIRYFGDYAYKTFQDFGEQLSIAHGLAAKNPWAQQPAALNKVSVDRYLWRHGLEAEEKNPFGIYQRRNFTT